MSETTEIEILRLKDGDAHVLDHVAPGVFDNPVDRSIAERYLACSHNVFCVARTPDGLVVGIASGMIHTHPDRPEELWVNEVGVGSDYRRQGIATKLLAAMQSHAREAGCTGLWVLTESGNDAANALYGSSMGWSGPVQQVMYNTDFE